jgi:hypothetical protein
VELAVSFRMVVTVEIRHVVYCRHVVRAGISYFALAVGLVKTIFRDVHDEKLNNWILEVAIQLGHVARHVLPPYCFISLGNGSRYSELQLQGDLGRVSCVVN